MPDPINDATAVKITALAVRDERVDECGPEQLKRGEELDIDFYGTYYQDLYGVSPDELSKHWSKFGQREGRHPNVLALVRARVTDDKLPDGFDVTAYLSLNPDVAVTCPRPWQAVLHYFEFGKSEKRQYKLPTFAGAIAAPTEPPVLVQPSNHVAVPDKVVRENAAPLQTSSAILDVEFYTSYYDDLATLTATEAAEHWKLHGRSEGRLPNLDAMIRNHANGRKFPTDFDVGAYLGANTDLIGKFSHNWQYIRHYLDIGIGEQRKYHAPAIDLEFVEALYGISFKHNMALPDEVQAVAADHQDHGNVTDWRRAEITEELRRWTGEHEVYVNVNSMLFSHDIYNTEMAQIFDYEYYYYNNSVVRQMLAVPNGAKCLQHFCIAGIKCGLSFSEHYAFDYDFYTNRYPEVSGLPVARAYLHWINVGYSLGWAPNGRLWLKRELGIMIPDPEVFDVELYQATNSDLAQITDRLELIVHLLTYGARETRYSVKPTITNYDVFTAIAVELSIRGDYVGANTIYERVLDQVPTAVAARHHYADNLLRQKQYLAAAECYRILIDRNKYNVWWFVNLAICYKAIGDLRRALYVLREGSLQFPDDMGLRRQVANAVEDYFQNEWHIAWQEARLGRAASCQGRVRRLCRDITPEVQNELPVWPIQSVAIVGDEALSQCRLYRIEQKMEQLAAAGFRVGYYEFNADLAKFLSDIADYEAVIFYRVPAFPRVVDAIIRSRELGIATIYEVDDLIFDPEHYPSPMESYREQITPEEYTGLVIGVPAFAHAMSLCEYGIASTPTLAAEMAKVVRSGRVFLHRNALGRRHEDEMLLAAPAAARDRIVIFYGSGTKAHKEDFEELIEPALIELVRRRGNRISIVTVGYISWTPAGRAIRDNIIQIEPTADIEAYWNLLRTADINLAVLKPSLMADCKSEIKWLEAAMFGVPSVVSRTATFAEVIEDGVTGFLCEDVDDWIAVLDRLVRDAHLRRRVGQAAQMAVQERYGIEAMKENLTELFAQLARPRPWKPTIVIVNVFYPPQAKGGATRVVYDNVARLRAAYADEFEIEVFATSEGGLATYETTAYAHEGVRVTVVTTPDDLQIDQKLFDKRMGEIFDQYLASVSPALVHFHCVQRLTVAVIDAARHRNIPYLITAHDGYWISNYQFVIDSKDRLQLYDYANPIAVMEVHGREAHLRMSVQQKALQGAQRVLCVSEAFARLYKQCNVPNVMALPNGVSALPQMVRRPSQDGRVRLAHLGGEMRHKGLHLVKYALLSERFDNLRLTVVDHAQIAGFRRSEVWGTTPVDIVGKLPQKEVGELYAEIDVLLAPSVWPESYGLVTREALACGCWVVASDRGAVGEYVVDDENGFTVDVEGIDGLVGALRKIDGDHRRYLHSPAAQPRLRHASDQADDLAHLYRSIISGNGENGASTGSVGDPAVDGVKRRQKRARTARRPVGSKRPASAEREQ
jgi:glycosyltransferase involved in cell wall biosynthesis